MLCGDWETKRLASYSFGKPFHAISWHMRISHVRKARFQRAMMRNETRLFRVLEARVTGAVHSTRTKRGRFVSQAISLARYLVLQHVFLVSHFTSFLLCPPKSSRTIHISLIFRYYQKRSNCINVHHVLDIK